MRSNDLAADALDELAELLAISGGDPFKVRAYEKAARAVREYPLEIDTLDAHGLDAIPSVGSRIAAKIKELCATGTISELEELRAHVPAGLRACLGVPGLGPRRAHQVYDELGISSLPELLDALHEHRLQRLKGWGPKVEDNVLRAISDASQAGGRVPLPSALAVAEEVLAAVSAVPGVTQACPAGSLRRMKETIGDVDILVAGTDPDAVMRALCTAPFVTRVLSHGPTRSSVVTTRGLQVDLRVVDPDAWGAALQYFTGSKEHNVRLRAIARRRGLKLSEYGLFLVDDDTLLVSRTEEEVYDRLDLPWIPPTLREDRGEVDAAQDGRLPTVIELRDIRGDLHLHTDLTDGLATLDDMVAAARSHGYRYCAITDHAPLLSMQRMTLEKALAQRAAIRQLAVRDVAVLHGSELNIQPDGSLDWDDATLAGFDVLVASVHSHFRQSPEEMTRRLVRAMENPYVNVIGHPTGRSLGRRAPVEFDHDEVFRAAARTGTALEINAFPDRLDLNDELARRARDLGVRFVINTDAHAVRHLDHMRFGVATAQRGWVEPAQVVNTWSLRQLQHFLRRKREGARSGGARSRGRISRGSA